MHIKFIAQSGVIINHNDITVAIDLWFDNPVNPQSLEDISKIDYLFLTHDHYDHGFKDMAEIAKRDKSHFICDRETSSKAEGLNYISGNIGGEYKVGDLRVVNTHAYHTSDTGIPKGFIIKFPDGFTVFHLGDTGFYSEMQDYAELYPIDLLLVPIGGFYTMGPTEAAYACSKIKAKRVIPIHYNTFEKIAQDPEDFKAKVAEYNLQSEVILLKPGESLKM